MGLPITTKQGICFAFPDVCFTPVPPPVNEVPIPYPNIGQLADATGHPTTVFAGGKEVITKDSEIPNTTGDEAGTGGGLRNGRQIQQKVSFVTFSQTVFAEGSNIVRFSDTTQQNETESGANAVGQVLGGVPTVMVGG